jgi:peptide/nickel transport system substrate-binding protein
MPDGSVYKGLQPYFDSAKPLLEKYPTNEFNPDKGAKLLAELGWKKDGSGMYLDADGKPFTMEIISFFDFPSVGPVLVELLRRQGMNATYGQPPDMFDRFFAGNYNAVIFGHGGSVSDPYATLRLYQSSSEAIPGGHLVNLSRWKNADYDKIVDNVYAHAVLSPAADEPDLLEGLSDQGRSLRQPGLLPFDLCAGPAQAAGHDLARKNCPRPAAGEEEDRPCLSSTSSSGSGFSF